MPTKKKNKYVFSGKKYASFNEAAGAAVAQSLWLGGENVAIEEFDSRGKFVQFIGVTASTSVD